MQPQATPIEWATLIMIGTLLIACLTFFIKLLDKSRDHGERIGRQEEKNTNFEKVTTDISNRLDNHIEDEKETKQQITKIKEDVSYIKGHIDIMQKEVKR